MDLHFEHASTQLRAQRERELARETELRRLWRERNGEPTTLLSRMTDAWSAALARLRSRPPRRSTFVPRHHFSVRLRHL